MPLPPTGNNTRACLHFFLNTYLTYVLVFRLHIFCCRDRDEEASLSNSEEDRFTERRGHQKEQYKQFIEKARATMKEQREQFVSKELATMKDQREQFLKKELATQQVQYEQFIEKALATMKEQDEQFRKKALANMKEQDEQLLKKALANMKEDRVKEPGDFHVQMLAEDQEVSSHM